MKYRKFGSTGFDVSALGLGCMRLPTQRFLPFKVDTARSIKLIRSAIEQGVNYIDTAYLYHFGESEKVVGQALQDGYRPQVHLVTKLPIFLVNKDADFDKYLHAQLERLRTDTLDTYLFHAMHKGGLEKIKKLNLLEKMRAAQKSGKITYIGFSFHDTLPVFKELVDLFPWDVVLIQYNYMDTGMQAATEGLRYAAQKGIAVAIMEPLKGGQLANPPEEAVAVMRNAATQRAPVDWALQYLWNLPEVSVVLSGMGSQKMLDENCASADRSGIGSLSAEDLRVIDELTAIYRKSILVPCTACQYCLPCPYGVNIPQNFALLNNLAVEKRGWIRWGMAHSYKKLAAARGKLNADQSNGSAALCTNCGVCVPKCPQTIRIPDELRRVQAILKDKKKIEDVYPHDR